MKKIGLLAILFGLTIAAIPVNKDREEGISFTSFEGTLVDTKCYSMMPKANAGNDHQVMQMGKMMNVPNCAAACAGMGIPVALLDKNGEMHVLAAPAGQLANHMAKEARIEGKKMNGILAIDKLEVKDGEKWVEVELVYMM